MTPPIDFLATELAKVPLRCSECGRFSSQCDVSADKQLTEADYPALAAAARKWMREHLSMSTVSTANPHDCGYRDALADVTKALGLTP